MKTCQVINKTKHPNKGELKAQDGRTQVQAKIRNHQQKVHCKENMNKSSTQTPSHKEHIKPRGHKKHIR